MYLCPGPGQRTYSRVAEGQRDTKDCDPTSGIDTLQCFDPSQGLFHWMILFSISQSVSFPISSIEFDIPNNHRLNITPDCGTYKATSELVIFVIDVNIGDDDR